MESMETREDERGVPYNRDYARFSPWTWIFFWLAFAMIVVILGLTGRSLWIQNNNSFVWDESDMENEPFECLKRRGCRAWKVGWDITGDTNHMIYTTVEIPGIDNPCDCLDLCKDQSGTCQSWAWMFTETETRRRSCVLSSGIAAPQSVVINYDTSPSAEPINTNPQIGYTVRRCLGYTLSPSTIDEKCVSGLSMLQGDGNTFC